MRRYAAIELGCTRRLRDAVNTSVTVCDDDARVTLVARFGANVVDVERHKRFNVVVVVVVEVVEGATVSP